MMRLPQLETNSVLNKGEASMFSKNQRTEERKNQPTKEQNNQTTNNTKEYKNRRNEAPKHRRMKDPFVTKTILSLQKKKKHHLVSFQPSVGKLQSCKYQFLRVVLKVSTNSASNILPAGTRRPQVRL